MNFIVDSHSFYSATLGFLVYHHFPTFATLDIRTNVVSATLVAGPFLIFSLFPSFEVPSSKSLADFPVLGGPKGLTSNLSFPKASKHHLFQAHLLAAFPFVLLPKWVDFFLSG